MRRPWNAPGRAAKRAIDFAFCLVGLTLLALPFLLIALIVRLDSRGPALFRQERIGRDGKPFRVFKFRTMVMNAVEQGRGYGVVEQDPRITRFGRILREWGIDELPQLLNVLRGEMSLVGPRPALRYQVEQYTPAQRRRLDVKPGITGWALVNGRRTLAWDERIALDAWYVDHQSLLLDLRILLRTVKVVLVTREGLYSDEKTGAFGTGWPEDGKGEGEA